MKKTILTLTLLLILTGITSAQYVYIPFKVPAAIPTTIVSDTGKSLDSVRYIYPCGLYKYLKANVYTADGLGTDTLVFFTVLPNGRYDTLAFKVERTDAIQTVLVLPTSGSVKIFFWEPYPDYEVIVKHTNAVYNSARKWFVDWIIGYLY